VSWTRGEKELEAEGVSGEKNILFNTRVAASQLNNEESPRVDTNYLGG